MVLEAAPEARSQKRENAGAAEKENSGPARAGQEKSQRKRHVRNQTESLILAQDERWRRA